MPTITQANMRISAVDGTAFIDFSEADTLTTKIGHLLRVKDSTGKSIQGYIKAAGTGETLDTEHCDDVTMSTAGNWTAGAGWVVNGASSGKGVATAATGSLVDTAATAMTALVLFKRVTDVVVTSGTLNHRTSGVSSPSISGSATVTQYGTALGSGNAAAFLPNTFTGSVDNASSKVVLTPSATGVTITSAKGNATYNWRAQEAAFDYNDAAGYTYEFFNNEAMLMNKSLIWPGM